MKKQYEANRHAKETILVFLLVALATIPFFQSPVGFYGLIVALLYVIKSLALKVEALVFLLIVLFYEIYHYTAFQPYDIIVSRQILYYFTVSILVLYYTKLNFLSIYIRIIYVFTIISFPIWIFYYADKSLMTSVTDSIPSLFVSTKTIYETLYKQANPIFYNFSFNYLLGRNNGPFWEPTVFATMLIIAQIFNLLLNKKLFNKHGIIFTIGIVTTLSTTGFIAYFVLISSYLLLSKRIKVFYKMLGGISFILLSIVLFSNLSFLQTKINEEVEGVDDSIRTLGGNSRLASAILDIAEVSQSTTYVLWGKGSSKHSRIAALDKDVLRNCGDTALFVEWCVFFTLLYLGLLYYSFLQLTKHYGINRLFSVVFTVIFILVSYSEVFFDLPFFHSFLFMGFIVKRYYPPKVNITSLESARFGKRESRPDFLTVRNKVLRRN